eukprot:1139077-Pelagomonas_calceolata.AAC.5
MVELFPLCTSRDSRIVLEQAGDAAWHRLLMATYQLERLEHEEQRLSACGRGVEQPHRSWILDETRTSPASE